MVVGTSVEHLGFATVQEMVGEDTSPEKYWAQLAYIKSADYKKLIVKVTFIKDCVKLE